MVPFNVVSNPPGSQVDVNGVTLGVTPTRIELQCSRRWVGVAVAPGGRAYDNAMYEVTVYPPKENPGLSQTKRVNACQLKNPPGNLSFDLSTTAPHGPWGPLKRRSGRQERRSRPP
ncbi:MAG: PEGA domain-containing protein [Phycisphaerae bacterium]